MEKPLIAVLRGGYSGESVISHQSASCMMRTIDTERYLPVHVTIERERWSCATAAGDTLEFDRGSFTVTLPHGKKCKVDAALIAIHGSPGEDGHVQGMLDMLRIPYQTGDVLNMAITFSKFTTVALLRQLGFTVAPSVLVTRSMPDALQRAASMELPCFVKPDRSGSSLGVSKVKHPDELQAALDAAFAECNAVLVERAVSGRELTCGVMRLDGRTKALPVCEVRTSREFFDYEAKYHAKDTEEIVPALLPEEVTALVQERSVAIYDALDCKGMVRVDHFWTGSELVTIELNTVPGFSEASIFPKMLNASGIKMDQAVNGLIADMLAGKH